MKVYCIIYDTVYVYHSEHNVCAVNKGATSWHWLDDSDTLLDSVNITTVLSYVRQCAQVHERLLHAIM